MAVYETVDLSSTLSASVLCSCKKGTNMQIQQSTYGNLHHRTRSKFPTTLDENTKVFVARQGTRIVGTAFVTHNQIETRPWFEERQLECTVTAQNETARTELIRTARTATSYLKRRFSVN